MPQVHTHYDNLKVARDAPASVIRAAYRALSQQWHPDKSTSPNSEQIMVLINRSYAVLSDPDRRRAHDAWILEEEAVAKRKVEAKQSYPEEDDPVWAEPVHSADQSSNRRTGIPARLWILIAVSVLYLVWITSDSLFADDQAAEIAIQIPAKAVGIEATSFTPTDTAELQVEPAKPRNEPERDRAMQQIPKQASKQASVDKGSVDAITPSQRRLLGDVELPTAALKDSSKRRGAVADFTTCERPEYPRASQRNEEEGVSTLSFLVSVDGTVLQSKVVQSSGYAELDAAALSALSRCRFTPAEANGKPAQQWTPVQYVWTLE